MFLRKKDILRTKLVSRAKQAEQGTRLGMYMKRM